MSKARRIQLGIDALDRPSSRIEHVHIRQYLAVRTETARDQYAAIIARGLKLSPGEVEEVLHASRMHDVGKLGIPDDILRKPASLEKPEQDVMRQVVRGKSRVAGPDIILAHQFLKNDVEPRTYVLFTDAAVERLGIDPDAAGMARYTAAT